MKSPTSTRKNDRRVQRTRNALNDALFTLMHEKPFDAITIQEILDLASVSRSTFYTHFRDKDDLFLSHVDEVFHGMANLLTLRVEASQRVAPVREVLDHIISLGEVYNKIVASGKQHQTAMELAQEHVARGIEQRLARLSPPPANASMGRSALAYALAGAMFSLTYWWLDRAKSVSPAQMDELFHQMVWEGVGREKNVL